MPFKKSLDTEGYGAVADLRANIVKEKIDENQAKIQSYVSNHETLAASSNRFLSTQGHESDNCLSLRLKNPTCKVGRVIEGLSDKDDYNLEEILSAADVKLPKFLTIPPFTTWIFLKRNQLMADDQSLIGKKRIYYEKNSREPLICSDSEEEPGEETVAGEHEFPEQEYHTEREVSRELSLANRISTVLTQIFGEPSVEIQERSDIMEKDQQMEQCNLDSPVEDRGDDVGFMEKSLHENSDSFDALFCRRCLVFDCRLHGCPETAIFPRKKQPFHPEKDSKPCGDHCYLKDLAKSSVEASQKQSDWKPFEKDMYREGIKIFGKNSCYIARNLLAGLKTCKEVADYMDGDGATVSHSSGGELDKDHMEPVLPDKSSVLKRKGRSRNRELSWKAGAHPSLRKIVNGKDQLHTNFTPCGCQYLCGKQCPCRENGTSCEKSCGCSTSCENRFKGCACTKSKCRGRRCPCAAAGRECDPDVCKNCWISCGDGSLGEPSERPSGQCSNQNILQGKHKRILLAESDVSGWGAFLKNPACKDDFLGEYTGELISHEEAERRGKVYDRENKSYLFNLNDEYVIDAYRMGNSFRFVNHSSNPNSYAKVMLSNGDHHVAIYAKRNMESCEELLYDYGYDPDKASRALQNSSKVCMKQTT